MFRYIGLVWSSASQDASSFAAVQSLALQHHPDWRGALRTPGLEVFIAGANPRSNTARCLADGRGVVIGQLFRQQQTHAEPLPPHPSQVQPFDADESAAIARTCGRLLVEGFWGRYVAFLRTDAGTTSVLRDPSGSLPCYVARHHGVHIFFSWLEDLLAVLPQWPVPAVSWKGLAGRFAFGELTGRATALEGIQHLLPGERLDLNTSAPEPTQRHTQFWSAQEKAGIPAFMAPDEAAEALRATVRHCAQTWASCYDALLLRLSGGVDSSILLSCLAHGQTPARVTCLNYHSSGADGDERVYARLAAAQAQRELVERARDTRFQLERVLDVACTPSPPSYVGRTSARTDAELANAIGARAMFTGGGGDQLFFEFHEWWPAADYLRLHGADRGFFEASMCAARLGRVSVWRAMALALADRFRSRPPLLEAHKHWTLIGDFVRQQGAEPTHFVHPSLLAASNLPIGKLTQALQLVYSAGYYDPYERAAAPELVNPLLSQPLVELCLRLPTYQLALGGRGRGLARQAFVADLPPQIASRRTKGGMEAHTRSLLLRNMAFVRQMLLDGELVRHGILDRVATENALSRHTAPADSLIGELHLCLAVEAWLRRWSQGPAAGSSQPAG